MPDPIELTDWRQRRTDEELRDIRSTLSRVVPREEHEQKWRADDYRFKAIEEKVDTANKKVEEVDGKVDSLLGRGFFTLVTAFIGPIVAIVVSHFLK